MATGLAASVEHARAYGVSVRFVAARRRPLIDVDWGQRVTLTINRWYGLSGDQLAALIDAQMAILRHADAFYFEQQQVLLPAWPQFAARIA
jgi:hypothetical protein